MVLMLIETMSGLAVEIAIGLSLGLVVATVVEIILSIRKQEMVSKQPDKIEYFDCKVCKQPYPTIGRRMLKGIAVCANCYVKNKRLFTC